jgi:hypothetical protein
MSNRYSQYRRPSASLIHEMRMIAQSFLSNRNGSPLFGKPTKIQASTLMCVPCHREGRSRDAIAVDGGRSVCATHIS